jgi:hypothetical protein
MRVAWIALEDGDVSTGEETHTMRGSGGPIHREPRLHTPGPLIILRTNSRSFAAPSEDIADEQIVCLTGSHSNYNCHDGLGFEPDCVEEPERFDYDAYCMFHKAHGHNFMRLWRWE